MISRLKAESSQCLMMTAVLAHRIIYMDTGCCLGYLSITMANETYDDTESGESMLLAYLDEDCMRKELVNYKSKFTINSQIIFNRKDEFREHQGIHKY